MTFVDRIVSWFGRATRDPSLCVGCGPRARENMARVVQGPGIVICERCATEAAALVGRTGPGAAYPDNDNVTQCEFCGTERASASGLVGWPRGAICRNCLDLAQELFRQRPA